MSFIYVCVCVCVCVHVCVCVCLWVCVYGQMLMPNPLYLLLHHLYVNLAWMKACYNVVSKVNDCLRVMGSSSRGESWTPELCGVSTQLPPCSLCVSSTAGNGCLGSSPGGLLPAVPHGEPYLCLPLRPATSGNRGVPGNGTRRDPAG